MSVDAALTGRTFTAPPYLVTTERIAEFRRALGDEPAGDPDEAPFTFAMVVAFGLMTHLMTDPTVGIELRNVVHRDERIDQVRPVRAGDRLNATLAVESVRSAAGVDLIATRTDVSTAEGEPVCTARATLAHRAEQA
jgi:MaoC dehydratase-like protein